MKPSNGLIQTLSNLTELEKKSVAMVSSKIANAGEDSSFVRFYHMDMFDALKIPPTAIREALSMRKSWEEWLSIIRNFSPAQKTAFAAMMSEMIKAGGDVDKKKKETYLIACGFAEIPLPETEYFEL